MKIKMLAILAGQDFTHKVDAVIDVDQAEAKRLVERGLAELYIEKKIDVLAERKKLIECAIAAPPPERAVSVAPPKARFQQPRGAHQ